MRAALGLARRGLGRVWPNPAVGCILVKDDKVVGRGWTQPGGRPHAETEALGRAGSLAGGATAYVTLEPCAHHGKTPPCAKALAEAKVARVVAAIEDPDPRVSGRGFDLLRAAGIAVEVGLLAGDAEEINAGFFCRVIKGRPLVTLKLATSQDGRIATHKGESRWITGPLARAEVHRLRAEHDAVMIGIGTAMADDPELSVRLPGFEHRQPIRIVVDGRLRLSLTSKLVRQAGTHPLWLVTRKGAEASRRKVFESCGVEIIEIAPDAEGNVDHGLAMAALGERGLTRVLVEGGAHLAAALLRHGLIDRVAWFRAPMLIGGDGVPALVAFGVDHLSEAIGLERLAAGAIESDMMEVFTVTKGR